LKRMKDQDARWFCPYYVDVSRCGDRRYIHCEGGAAISFDDFRRFDAFADRYCRGRGYRACTTAQERDGVWGVDGDG